MLWGQPGLHSVHSFLLSAEESGAERWPTHHKPVVSYP
ncbi:hypothetical protein LEMLEM_LOCUS19766 [Lemmus lemmus]